MQTGSWYSIPKPNSDGCRFQHTQSHALDMPWKCKGGSKEKPQRLIQLRSKPWSRNPTLPASPFPPTDAIERQSAPWACPRCRRFGRHLTATRNGCASEFLPSLEIFALSPNPADSKPPLGPEPHRPPNMKSCSPTEVLCKPDSFF